MPGIDLSIIIVSYNTRDYLKNCLVSVYASAGTKSYEVIVVDNCSMDGSPEMVEATFPQVMLIKPGANLGFARANNLGAKSAHGKYLLFLNPDTVVFPNTFANMIEFMDGKPKAGAANCKLLNEDGSVQLLATRRKPTIPIFFLESLGINRRFPNNPFNRKYIMADWDRKDARTVEVISGAFFMVRSGLYMKLHGFDERYFMYVEDFEFSSRITASGNEIWFNPNSCITHYGGKSSTNFPITATTKGIDAIYKYLIYTSHNSLAFIYKLILIISFIFRYVYLSLLMLLFDNISYHKSSLSSVTIYYALMNLGKYYA